MKNYFLKRSLLLLAAMFYLMQAKAQELDQEWTLLRDTDGVKISYAASACETDQILSLKIENSNPSFAFINLMLEVSEGEHRLLYPRFSAQLEPESSEILDCRNLGSNGDFIPFTIQQIENVELSLQMMNVHLN